MVICLEQGADLHMAQLMPLPLTVSCSSKIQISFTFLVPAQPGSPGKRTVKWVCGPGLPRWAGTRRNIHPLTPILVIGHPLSTSSIYYDPQHPLYSVYVLDNPPNCQLPTSLSTTSFTADLRRWAHNMKGRTVL